MLSAAFADLAKDILSRINISFFDYFMPGPGGGTETFVEHPNLQRYQESLNKVTPVDAKLGGAQAIIKQRERIK